MPFERPTLTEIKADVAADISSATAGGDATLRFGNLTVMGKAQAAQSNAQYGYLDWINRMAVPVTAEDEYLEMWAGLKAVTRKPPVAGQYVFQFTGAPGAQIQQGLTIVRGNFQYLTTQTAAVAAGATSVTVTAQAALALTDLYGSLWNAPNGAPATLGVGVVGMSSNGTLISTSQPGIDVETDDSLRARMLQAYATPPAGGAQTDYVAWAEAVPGVTRAWCARDGMGPGTVVVFVMTDTATAPGFPAGTNGVASDETRDINTATGAVLVVANYIYALQPVTALVYVVSPPQNQIGLTVSGLATAGSDVQTNVTAAVNAVLLAQGAQGGVVDLGAIEAAIQAVSGAAAAVVTAVTATAGTIPTPIGNITSSPTAVPCLGAIIWA